MRCERCVLEDKAASDGVEDFLEKVGRCTECPLVEGEGASPVVRLLVARHRESARALRKLGNRSRAAENALNELQTEVAKYESKISVLEAFQKASAVEVESELAARSAQLVQKERQIVELSTPIIHVWEGVLVLPIIGAFDERRADIVMASLLDEVVRMGASHTILDLTAVPEAEAGTAERIARVARAVRLLGADVIVTGLRPAVARSMASIGTELGGVRTARSLAQALQLVLRHKNRA